MLRVWKLDRSADQSIQGFEFGKEIVIKVLPKRAAILHWLAPNHSTPSGSEELIVIDRFGDVRSILVNENDVRTLPSSSANSTNQGAAQIDEQDQMDSPDDPSMQILLGHVSMITGLAFVASAKPGSPPPFIITGDRDEHIRISRWGSKRMAYVIDRYLQGSEAFVGALAVVPDADGTLRLVSSEGGHSLRVWALPPPTNKASDPSADGSSLDACVSINDLGSALAPHVLARDREERRREAKAVQESNKRHKAAKRKQDQRSGEEKPTDQAESKPTAAQYSKTSQPTVVITDLIPFKDAHGQELLLIVVEGATAFFHVPLSALLTPLSSGSCDKERDISDQIRVTRAPVPILHLTLLHRHENAGTSVIATFDTRPEFRSEEPTENADAEVGVFTLNASGDFERLAKSALVEAILPAKPSESATEEAPRALLDQAIVENLGLYPALTTWPKIEVPSSAEIIATRSSRKGRFNHPLDTSLIGVAEVSETKPSSASTNPAGDDEQRRKLVKTMGNGKRERGRAKNREAIRLAQEQSSQ